jgi:broad specificity phosphatase PhoE
MQQTMAKKIHVKIIRHSERLDYTNPAGWMLSFGYYWNDTPLTSKGCVMARTKGQQMASNGFCPTHIYTSPYNRTISTATEIMASYPNSSLMIEPLLSEYQPSYGHTVSLYPSGIPTTFRGEETDFSYPETMENLDRRVRYIISKLIEAHETDFLIVTHGEIIKTFATYLGNMYSDVFIDLGGTTYLTALCFDFDKENQKIIPETICVEIFKETN